MALENVVDNLRDGYSRLEKGSFRQVDQLHKDREDDHSLRGSWFYTADGQGYFPREDGGIDWAITPEEANLVLRHIGDKENGSYDQLVQNGNFVPDNAEAEIAKDAEDTVVVDMSQLRSSGNDSEYRFLSIRTETGSVRTKEGDQQPNEEELKAMVRLGYTSRTLNMLSKNGISETRIYFLNPEYVIGKLEGSDNNSLWRASWLYNFFYNSNFVAGVCDVGNHISLRGVRRGIAEGDAPETEVPQARSTGSNSRSLLQNTFS